MYTIKSLPTLLLLVSCFVLEISLKFDYMLAIFLSLPINLKITEIKSIYMYFRETDVNIRSVVSVTIYTLVRHSPYFVMYSWYYVYMYIINWLVKTTSQHVILCQNKSFYVFSITLHCQSTSHLIKLSHQRKVLPGLIQSFLRFLLFFIFPFIWGLLNPTSSQISLLLW